MYDKKTNYLTGAQNTPGINQSADIASIGKEGFIYYQVFCNQDACEKCLDHDGAIYSVVEAKEGYNLPPFHPNCTCGIEGFDIEKPNGIKETLVRSTSRQEKHPGSTFINLLPSENLPRPTSDGNISSSSSGDNTASSGNAGSSSSESSYDSGNINSYSNSALEALKSLEGFEGGAYTGADVGNRTIGYGHVIREGDDLNAGLTEKQATDLLKVDLVEYVSKLNSFINENALMFNQSQYDALISFSYNLGPYVWKKEEDFDFIKILKSGKWTNEQIIYEMGRFDKAADIRLEGLWRRHTNEALLFTTGTFKNYSIKELNDMGFYWPNKGK